MNIFRKIAYWLVWNVPLGDLAPYVFAYSINSKPIKLYNFSSKRTRYMDYLTVDKLKNMREGETFALASLDGIRVFQMTEFKESK